MPPKANPPQKNSLLAYFTRTPSQPSRNAAFASTPPAPATIQETPVAATATPPDYDSSLLSSSASSSPLLLPSSSPSAQPSLAINDGASDTRRSSLPQSSGQSGKRVFSQGQQVVLNSDSDSDLSDLDDRFEESEIRPKSNAAAPRTQEQRDRVEGYVLSRPPKRRRDDGAFRHLVRSDVENAEMERQIAEAQAEMDRPLRTETPGDHLIMSEEMLAGALKDDDDPEKARKILTAMQRTNALHMECAFHFFDHDLDSRSSASPSFPKDVLPQHKSMSMFKDTARRDQAFMSGIAHHVFRRELPRELIVWMIDEVCMGRNESLSEAYVRLLALHPHDLEGAFDASRLHVMFARLGVNKMYLDTASKSELIPSYELDPKITRRLPSSLLSVCKLIQLAAPGIRSNIRVQALHILFCMCLDDRVRAADDILHAVQDSIELLTRTVTSNSELAVILDDLISSFLVRIKHPVLQQNLVCALPVRSPLTASIQRYLALSFLLHPTRSTYPFGSPEALRQFHSLLKTSSKFFIAKSTDYATLTAHFTLLDIAIGPGPLAVPYQPLISPSASPELHGISFATALAPPSTDVQKFNHEVDALAKQIRVLGNGINVAGAITDLTRLAANDCCDRVCTRLENAVRIGGRKIRNVFGDGEEENAYSQAKLGNWLKGAKAAMGGGDGLTEKGPSKRRVSRNGDAGSLEEDTCTHD